MNIILVQEGTRQKKVVGEGGASPTPNPENVLLDLSESNSSTTLREILSSIKIKDKNKKKTQNQDGVDSLASAATVGCLLPRRKK